MGLPAILSPIPPLYISLFLAFLLLLVYFYVTDRSASYASFMAQAWLQMLLTFSFTMHHQFNILYRPKIESSNQSQIHHCPTEDSQASYSLVYMLVEILGSWMPVLWIVGSPALLEVHDWVSACNPSWGWGTLKEDPADVVAILDQMVRYRRFRETTVLCCGYWTVVVLSSWYLIDWPEMIFEYWIFLGLLILYIWSTAFTCWSVEIYLTEAKATIADLVTVNVHKDMGEDHLHGHRMSAERIGPGGDQPTDYQNIGLAGLV